MGEQRCKENHEDYDMGETIGFPHDTISLAARFVLRSSINSPPMCCLRTLSLIVECMPL